MSTNNKSGLGKALMKKIQKRRFIGTGDKAPIFYQQTQVNEAEVKKLKLKSVIDQNSLSDFLQIAELSQQDFHANRDIKFKEIKQQIKNKKIVMNKQKRHFQIEQMVDQRLLSRLQLPRRPDWRNTKKQQFEKKQTEAYLTWRRALAQVQQKNPEVQITPYQKNVQVWKQLWRVSQRSDLLIQIVDGRDPLFFRCDDLVQYIHQLDKNKKSLLLINKSDLVQQKKRLNWHEYFMNNKIDHVFFSAVQVQQVVEDTHSETTQESDAQKSVHKYINQPNILTITQLMDMMNLFSQQFKKDKIEIGMVGYPNVGKSSVINSLFGKKKVAVASLPGKTKHFQTLPLTEKVTLCDCPGLVFPRISSSYAEMILNGLVLIDTLKHYSQAMEILALRISQKVICSTYALHWKQDDPYDGQTILVKWSTLKGFYGGNGLPNTSVAARNILKDYVKGNLSFAKNPPGYNTQINEQEKKENLNLQQKSEQVQQIQELNMKKKQKQIQKSLDTQFFQKDDIKTELGYEELVNELTEDDLLDIVQGKKIQILKITKQMRKQIKFALKRGQDLQVIKSKYFLGNNETKHKLLVKV